VPELWQKGGDLARSARLAMLKRFEHAPRWHEETKQYTFELRRELGIETATPLERLLIEQVVITWIDLHTAQVLYGNQFKGELSYKLLQTWDDLLSQRQARHLRAVETLARVRRLLNLPAPQLNINMPGGQQVNVQGEVKP